MHHACAHAVVTTDGAGWHQEGVRLQVPDKISLLLLLAAADSERRKATLDTPGAALHVGGAEHPRAGFRSHLGASRPERATNTDRPVGLIKIRFAERVSVRVDAPGQWSGSAPVLGCWEPWRTVDPAGAERSRLPRLGG